MAVHSTRQSVTKNRTHPSPQNPYSKGVGKGGSKGVRKGGSKGAAAPLVFVAVPMACGSTPLFKSVPVDLPLLQAVNMYMCKMITSWSSDKKAAYLFLNPFPPCLNNCLILVWEKGLNSHCVSMNR